MKIDKIITLANRKVRLQFWAMERSLRATGCQLPLWVIPYDQDLFELPKGATWWEIPEITGWLKTERAHPTMRKYQSLTVGNYQFVDADICFLRNPEEVLKPYSGFITSCGHWRAPEGTFTQTSKNFLLRKSTLWQRDVFNTGQFACDQALFTVEHLKATTMQPAFAETCLQYPYHEQPGLNLLVFASGIQVTNLTLPPMRMESTWACDYPDDYEHYWKDPERKPYLIHFTIDWIGNPKEEMRPINQIFYGFLTLEEKAEWNEQVRHRIMFRRKGNRSLRGIAGRFKRALATFLEP